MRPWSSTGQNFWQLVANYTSRRKYQLSTRVLAGLDPAIGYPQPIANDAIPISNHPMKITRSSPAPDVRQFTKTVEHLQMFVVTSASPVDHP
jgi:hypothetical protein